MKFPTRTPRISDYYDRNSFVSSKFVNEDDLRAEKEDQRKINSWNILNPNTKISRLV